MRNPDRIPTVLKLLEEAWAMEPDLRLGQLVDIIHSHISTQSDLFSIEDDILYRGIQNFIKENKRES